MRSIIHAVEAWGDRNKVWIIFAGLVPCILILAALITALYPTYFRGDDPKFIAWAAGQPNPISAFVTLDPVFSGCYRPIGGLQWWLLFRLFGLWAVGYQLFITSVFLFALLLFYLVVRRLFSPPVALFSAAAYFVLFYYMVYIIFYISSGGLALELLFLFAAMYLLAGKKIEWNRRTYMGLIFFAIALGFKEPSALILTSAIGIFRLSEWSRLDRPAKKRLALLLLILITMSAAWLALTPGPATRATVLHFPGWSEHWSFLQVRLNYYGGYLLSSLGFLIWAAAFYLTGVLWAPEKLGDHRGYRIPLLAGALIGAMALRSHPVTAMICLFLALGAVAVRFRRISLAAAWFLLPMLGICTMGYYVRTYMTEAIFGLALLVGYALAEGWSLLGAKWRVMPSRWKALAGASIGILAAAASILAVPGVVEKHRALVTLLDNRQCFREVYEYLESPAAPSARYLGVIGFEDLGTSEETILHLPDQDKAEQQKVMTVEEMRAFLSIRGGMGLEVEPLRLLRDSLKATEYLVWTMNRGEDEFLARQNLDCALIHRARRGTAVNALYRVRSAGPGLGGDSRPPAP